MDAALAEAERRGVEREAQERTAPAREASERAARRDAAVLLARTLSVALLAAADRLGMEEDPVLLNRVQSTFAAFRSYAPDKYIAMLILQAVDAAAREINTWPSPDDAARAVGWLNGQPMPDYEPAQFVDGAGALAPVPNGPPDSCSSDAQPEGELPWLPVHDPGGAVRDSSGEAARSDSDADGAFDSANPADDLSQDALAVFRSEAWRGPPDPVVLVGRYLENSLPMYAERLDPSQIRIAVEDRRHGQGTDPSTRKWDVIAAMLNDVGLRNTNGGKLQANSLRVWWSTWEAEQNR